MTNPTTSLRALVEKSADADVLRETIGFTAVHLMELEIGAQTRAEWGEKRRVLPARRNGYRARLGARAGTVELCIPRLRTGSCFRSFREPRRMAEKAPIAVIRETYIRGISTRSVESKIRSGARRRERSGVVSALIATAFAQNDAEAAPRR